MSSRGVPGGSNGDVPLLPSKRRRNRLELDVPSTSSVLSVSSEDERRFSSPDAQPMDCPTLA